MQTGGACESLEGQVALQSKGKLLALRAGMIQEVELARGALKAWVVSIACWARVEWVVVQS